MIRLCTDHARIVLSHFIDIIYINHKILHKLHNSINLHKIAKLQKFT